MTDLIKQTKIVTIDKGTGEVIEETKERVYKQKREDSFAKLYLDGGSTGCFAAASDLLLQLIGIMDYQGMVSFHSINKQKIAENMGVTDKSIYNKLNRLKDSGVVLQLAQGVLLINPFVAARGTWPKVQKLRQEWLVRLQNAASKNKKKQIDATLKDQEDALALFDKEIDITIDDFE